VESVVVVGLGYVGLPLAEAASAAGLTVRGLDISAQRVAEINAGRSYIDDLSDADLHRMRAQGFEAGDDPVVLAEASHVIICVPTPLAEDGTPDLGAVRSASRTVAQHVRPGTVVVLESTTYPGTTDEVLRPIFEEAGLRVGTDVFLAFSPERVDPGNPTYGIRNTPKVVGGCTDTCTERAVAMYARFVDVVVPAKGSREAETAKLLENTYRHVNIALVNEMAKFCHELGVDFWNVIELASTKPFGFQAFYPGPGVGGHCIPIDPNYLSYNVRTKLGYPFRFVELAQEINAGMPAYVVRRIQDVLNEDHRSLNGSRVLLLGVTYKADIADDRESPTRDVARVLREFGAEVQFHDPHLADWVVGGATLHGVDDLPSALREADIVVLLQAHREYLDEPLAGARRVLDTRGKVSGPNVVRL